MIPLAGRRAGAAAAPGPARSVSPDHLVVGKDIVELLSTAMYTEPLAVYREYVQNAADSIDAALRGGLLKSLDEGRIEIVLDPVERSARIRDNGMGVPAGDAERVLTAFGASPKRSMPAGEARGFRGVGRLAALGYAQVVTFRTKAAGEPRGTEVRWDCRRLRALLLDRGYTGSLQDIITEVVAIRQGAEEPAGLHYFEAHLEKLVRLRNDDLLNEHEVGRYLAQVAPVPLPRDFRFTEQIEAHLAPYLRGGHYDVRINGSPPLERPFRDEFALTQTKTDRFESLELVQVEDPDAGVVAVGWILHHNYLGAIHGSPEIRGLRARIGNVQIGGPDIFIDAFPETRFNAWTVGELHVLDPRVVPNGRRDNFEQNAAANSLAYRLVTHGREIARRCRASSTRRVQLKKFETAEQKARELLAIMEQGAVGGGRADTLGKEVGSLFGVMEKLAGGLVLDPAAAGLQARLDELRAHHAELLQTQASGASTGAAARVPERHRAAYTWAVDLIYECAVNRPAAKALVDRITARLAGVAEAPAEPEA